jgi:hypothetical protein
MDESTPEELEVCLENLPQIIKKAFKDCPDAVQCIPYVARDDNGQMRLFLVMPNAADAAL